MAEGYLESSSGSSSSSDGDLASLAPEALVATVVLVPLALDTALLPVTGVRDIFFSPDDAQERRTK